MNLRRYLRQKIRDAFSMVGDMTLTKSNGPGFIKNLKQIFGLKGYFSQSSDTTSAYFRVNLDSRYNPASNPVGTIFRISNHPQNPIHTLTQLKRYNFEQEKGYITSEMNPYFNLKYVFSLVFPGVFSKEYDCKVEKLVTGDRIYFSEKNIIPNQTTLSELVDWVNSNT